MWLEGKQRYDQLVWSAEKESLLKETLLDEMDLSIRAVVALKKGDYIFLNGKKARVHEKTCQGDEIRVVLPKENSEYLPQDIPLTIYYEDEDLLVVEKPEDMVVHPTRSHLYDTMLNAVLHYFRENGIESKVRFVNRLDRYTSGILIIAKNAYAHSVMTKGQSMWGLEKEYIAVVHGKLEGEGTIDRPIAKSEDGIRREVHPEGQNAVTHYEALSSNEEASLLKIRLETGRTHQIRVHFSSIGHPLLGDGLYGGDTGLIGRQALHSLRLAFHSPRKAEKVEIKIKLPKDIQELLEKISPDAGLDKID